MPGRNPFEDIENVFDRMNEQFEELSSQLEGEFVGDVDADVAETDDDVVVVADLPGYDSEDIDVSVSDRELTISADHGEDREEEREESDRRYHRRERTRRRITRRFRLPTEIVEEEAEAEYNNGVLTVTLPKAGGGDGDGTRIDVE